ncbi:MetQ/NlpA family ABC transporter substrate-binding protein [Pseudochelatococcus contaminans]|uniref:MetQ/NlpA family ABC transporter substrate-binding protein n=1 Tax=Pseudochelatococcus contaminans TaxID=1538103 RepID=UPI00161EF942|nr:MetQ/NlpA family ABC transporter substrate-binding protein [Pseudochelatococcus contaminans]
MNKGKRTLVAIAAAAIAAVGVLTAPVQGRAATVSSEPLQVYLTPTPQGDVIRFVQKLADEKGSGLKLKVIESSQGLDANQLVFKGDVDANLYQHQPYFSSWLAAHPDAKGEVVPVATLLVNIFGLYSSKFKSAQDIPEGASILVPNEQTNLPRALFILQKEGLIELDYPKSDGSSQAVAIDEKNIVSNPKKLKFVPTDTTLRAKSLPDVQASFINGDIALTNGINPDSALSLEDAENNPYANILAVRKELVDDPRVNLLVEYLTGPEVAKFIEDSYSGFIVPAQERLTPTP